jgi:low molecular weight protein-tyrosine phosphatase
MSDRDARVRVLFVCLGNICRSPTAEGVMRVLVRDAGLEDRIEIDSAGTGSWHIGDAPDARATAAARERGVVLEGEARQVDRGDFERFDAIIAMDSSNLADLRAIAPDDAARAKVRLLRELDPPADGRLDVPDPYHGGARGFDEVFDIVQGACAALLGQLRAGLGDNDGDPAARARTRTHTRAAGSSART